ncbi:MAG TPA: ferric reductase-like transmembrane domain-containing protein, partial [Verrucomicrobiae bacterium]|nr:ferric reductase-like transmembrane domain-containing protein [Verrucomicrobiae bacterium]
MRSSCSAKSGAMVERNGGPYPLARGDAVALLPKVRARSSGAIRAVLLMLLYPLLILAPLATAAALNPTSDHSRTEEVGIGCAAVGLAILALQFVITARLRWVEAPFGLDVLLVFHRVMALVATAALLVHPVLVTWGEQWPLLTRLRVP